MIKAEIVIPVYCEFTETKKEVEKKYRLDEPKGRIVTDKEGNELTEIYSSYTYISTLFTLPNVVTEPVSYVTEGELEEMWNNKHPENEIGVDFQIDGHFIFIYCPTIENLVKFTEFCLELIRFFLTELGMIVII